MFLSRHKSGGFSVTEVLVTISLATIFFTAAALVFQNVGANQKALSTVVNVKLDPTTATSEAIIANFYNLSASELEVYSAPNYGRASFADNMSEMFMDDVGKSAAIYCLARNDLNTIRPTTIAYTPSSDGALDTPEAFRQHLVSIDATAAGVFVEYRGATSFAFDPTTATALTGPVDDLSVFMVAPGNNPNELAVVAVYDLDIIPISGGGNYVSVRRYVQGLITGYYDVFYPAGTGDAFDPVCCCFMKKGLAVTESDANWDKYMIAEEQSFYFMWWPDPAARNLESPVSPPNPAAAAGTAPWDYYQMGGRTRYMFTFPMFPSGL